MNYSSNALRVPETEGVLRYLLPVRDPHRARVSGDIMPVVGVLHVDLANISCATFADLVAIGIVAATDTVVVRARVVKLRLAVISAMDQVVVAVSW